MKLSEIRAALLDGSGNNYRVLLLVKDRNSGMIEVPLSHYYSFAKYETKKALVNKINRLLAKNWERGKPGIPKETNDENGSDLVVVEDDRWFVYAFGFVFMSVFIIAVFVSKKEVCFLDKTENVLAIIRSSFLNRTEEVYFLSEIYLVEVHRNTQNRKTEYKVFFELEPSRSLELSSRPRDTIVATGPGIKWVSMCEELSYNSEEKAQQICDSIREFLGIKSWVDILKEKKKT